MPDAAESAHPDRPDSARFPDSLEPSRLIERGQYQSDEPAGAEGVKLESGAVVHGVPRRNCTISLAAFSPSRRLRPESLTTSKSAHSSPVAFAARCTEPNRCSTERESLMPICGHLHTACR